MRVKHRHQLLQMVLERTPALIGQWVKYVKLDPDISSRELKRAIALLNHAGLLHSIRASTAAGIPLSATSKQNKFKLFLLDIGLAQRALRLDSAQLLHEDPISIHRGSLAEQSVAQELLVQAADSPFPSLFSWHRDKAGSSAEIDFLTTMGSQMVPIEVKAGSTGRMRSLQQFLDTHDAPLGVRISSRRLALDGRILSVPFYLVSQLDRLVRSIDVS